MVLKYFTITLYEMFNLLCLILNRFRRGKLGVPFVSCLGTYGGRLSFFPIFNCSLYKLDFLVRIGLFTSLSSCR